MVGSRPLWSVNAIVYALDVGVLFSYAAFADSQFNEHVPSVRHLPSDSGRSGWVALRLAPQRRPRFEQGNDVIDHFTVSRLSIVEPSQGHLPLSSRALAQLPVV